MVRGRWAQASGDLRGKRGAGRLKCEGIDCSCMATMQPLMRQEPQLVSPLTAGRCCMLGGIACERPESPAPAYHPAFSSLRIVGLSVSLQMGNCA
jgi:hypothetical protein